VPKETSNWSGKRFNVTPSPAANGTATPSPRTTRATNSILIRARVSVCGRREEIRDVLSLSGKREDAKGWCSVYWNYNSGYRNRACVDGRKPPKIEYKRVC